MSIGIYKITNKITNQSYIGQSVHIERRWTEHCNSKCNSYIGQAIKQYGKNNFTFEIIEECSIKELNNKEEYWINFFNTLKPNGYNLVSSINAPIYCDTISKERLQQIVEDLKYNLELSISQIADKYHLVKSTIYRINGGYSHRLEEESYPLRLVKNHKPYERGKVKIKTERKVLPDSFCMDCGIKISKGCIRCKKCEDKNRKIPLEDMEVTRDELKYLIRTQSFVQIGKKYSVSDNTIRKWCDKFNLPRKKTEIQNYTNEEWEKI